MHVWERGDVEVVVRCAVRCVEEGRACWYGGVAGVLA